MTEAIQIYANGVDTEPEGDVLNVLLKGVDVAQIINEFNAVKVLECIENSTILDYLKTQDVLGREDEDFHE